MGRPTTAGITDDDPATRAAVRSATLERFTHLLTGTNSTTSTLTTWPGEPPTTHIHTRVETATLPEEAILLSPLGMRRRTLHTSRRFDYHRPLHYHDQDRAALAVSATLEIAHQQVALVKETYLEPILW
jgi:hypothetical protein